MRDISVFYPTNHCDSVRNFTKELSVFKEDYNFLNMPRRSYTSKYVEFCDLVKNSDVLMAWIGGGVEPKFGTSNSTVELLFDLKPEDFEFIKQKGVKIIGLSDVTYLLAALQNNGIECFYGPNLFSKFIQCGGDDERILMRDSLEKALSLDEYTIDLAQKEFNPSEMPVAVNGGKAKGRLIGANTDTLCAILRMYPEYMLKRQKGDVIFLEAVTPTYGDDGTAVQFEKLAESGFFDDAAAVIIGKGKNPVKRKGEERDWLNRQGEFEMLVNGVKQFVPENVPVIVNIPCGHVSPMLTLPLGKTVELDTDNMTLKILK